jgi:hypothetical protein
MLLHDILQCWWMELEGGDRDVLTQRKFTIALTLAAASAL